MRYSAGVVVTSRTAVSKLLSSPWTANFADIRRWFFHCQQMSSFICINRVLLKGSWTRSLLWGSFNSSLQFWVSRMYLRGYSQPRGTTWMRYQLIKAIYFTASWKIFPLQVCADKQVSSCISKLSSLTEILQESWCNRFLFSSKLNKLTSAVPTYYILFNVQSKRNSMLGNQTSTFWSFSYIQQQIYTTFRHKAVKLKVLTDL